MVSAYYFAALIAAVGAIVWWLVERDINTRDKLAERETQLRLVRERVRGVYQVTGSDVVHQRLGRIIKYVDECFEGDES